MREAELLSHIYRRSEGLHGRKGVVLGPGDDCAILEVAGQLLVTTDQLVGGRHFDAEATPVDLVARKAVARSVSDIAAMSGRPSAAVATGCLPDGYRAGDELFDRMAHHAAGFGCPLVGGDIAFSPGPLVLTVTVLGRPHEGRGPVLRSGARAGDLVCVTGRLGGSLASGRHLTFEPRLAEGLALCDALGADLHAMMDLSDGLGRDAGRMARASGVRIEIDAGRVPCSEGVSDWRRAIADGEDYELLFTMDPGARLPALAVGVSVVGRVVGGSGCVVRTPEGEEIDAAEMGWEHGS